MGNKGIIEAQQPYPPKEKILIHRSGRFFVSLLGGEKTKGLGFVINNLLAFCLDELCQRNTGQIFCWT